MRHFINPKTSILSRFTFPKLMDHIMGSEYVVPRPNNPRHENPRSCYFDPKHLSISWRYSIDEMRWVLRAKAQRKIIYVMVKECDYWSVIDPDHPTQFNFCELYYTATKPKTYWIKEL